MHSLRVTEQHFEFWQDHLECSKCRGGNLTFPLGSMYNTFLSRLPPPPSPPTHHGGPWKIPLKGPRPLQLESSAGNALRSLIKSSPASDEGEFKDVPGAEGDFKDSPPGDKDAQGDKVKKICIKKGKKMRGEVKPCAELPEEPFQYDVVVVEGGDDETGDEGINGEEEDDDGSDFGGSQMESGYSPPDSNAASVSLYLTDSDESLSQMSQNADESLSQMAQNAGEALLQLAETVIEDFDRVVGLLPAYFANYVVPRDEGEVVPKDSGPEGEKAGTVLTMTPVVDFQDYTPVGLQEIHKAYLKLAELKHEDVVGVLKVLDTPLMSGLQMKGIDLIRQNIYLIARKLYFEAPLEELITKMAEAPFMTPEERSSLEAEDEDEALPLLVIITMAAVKKDVSSFLQFIWILREFKQFELARVLERRI